MPVPTSSIRQLRAAVFSAAPGLEVAEALFGSMNDVLFCVKDDRRRYVAANDAFVRRARLRTSSELLGRTAREIFPPLLASGYEQQDDEVLGRGISVRDRLEMITQADGAVGWFVSQKVAVRDASGRVVGLAGISRDLDTPAAAGAELGALAAALAAIHSRRGEPLRIGELAEASGLSWSQFQRRIRAVTGLSPRQLLTKARVEAAAEALRGTRLSLGEIAAEGGFYDQAAFSRQFRAATGISPGEYRRAARAFDGRAA